MLDYDSKFEGMIKNLEEQEWIDSLEDSEKYLYEDDDIDYQPSNN